MTHPPAHIEFLLAFVIKASQVQQPRADRRLNAIENTLVALARQWRQDRPLEPVKELRMASATLVQLRGWVEGAEAADGHAAARLRRYRTTIADEVPVHWVRLLVASQPTVSATTPDRG